MHITAEQPIAAYVRVVLLNGMDVTALTMEADTVQGWVKMLVVGVDGDPLSDHKGNVMTLQVYGRVVVGMKQMYPCTFCHAVFGSPGTWAQHIKQHTFVPN
ncbi:MAG: hypothetical protein HC804_04105 [Anaerolineae bacterium]|nr:hypothetical protein [Anaerolineae bacterium]